MRGPSKSALNQLGRLFLSALIAVSLYAVNGGTDALAVTKGGPGAHADDETTGFIVTDGIVVPRHDNILNRPAHLPGRLIVKLREGKTTEDIRAIKVKHALKISEKKLANSSHHRFKNIYDIKAGKEKDIIAIANELMGNEAVEYAEPVSISYAQLVPNDPLYVRDSHIGCKG